MAKLENAPTIIGVTQQLEPEHWDWVPEAKLLLVQGADVIVAHMVWRLVKAGCEVESAYGIIHDRDEREVWDEFKQQVVTELKPRHIHVVIKFTGREKSKPLNQLAVALGLAPQFVEKPGRGRYAHDNMLSYLTHAKYAEKFQYAPTDVVTVCGPDYQGIDAMRRSDWLKGRASVAIKKAAEGFDDLWEKCFSGEVTLSQIELTDDYRRIYALNKRKIDDALESYGGARATKAALALREGKFSTAVIYVTGKSGLGKTRFAMDLIQKQIAHAAEAGERWSMYKSATSNPLDDWAGEEVLLLDDLRASAMGATEWLLLLDPYNASPAAARYKNKQNVAPRLIVITASIEPVEFFFYVRQRGEVNEALDQFIRRLSAMVHVIREDEIDRYEISMMGKVPEYSRLVTTARGAREHLTLTYGAVETVDVIDGQIVSDVIVGEVAKRSSDVQLPGFDWDGLLAISAKPVQLALPASVTPIYSAPQGVVYAGG